MTSKDEFDTLIDRFSESLGIDSSAGKDEWIPLFSDIRILGYHGYLDTMDIWIPWIVRYHGYLDNG